MIFFMEINIIMSPPFAVMAASQGLPTCTWRLPVRQRSKRPSQVVMKNDHVQCSKHGGNIMCYITRKRKLGNLLLRFLLDVFAVCSGPCGLNETWPLSPSQGCIWRGGKGAHDTKKPFCLKVHQT